MHKKSIGNYKICGQLMDARFGKYEYYQGKNCDGRKNIRNLLATCQTTWKLKEKKESVHALIHTLYETPR